MRAARHAQSLTREVTVRGETLDRSILADHVGDLVRELAEELRRQALTARQLVLRVRYLDGAGAQTRSHALGAPTAAAAELLSVAALLVGRTQIGQRRVRTLGVQLSQLAPAGVGDRQLDLFPAGS